MRAVVYEIARFAFWFGLGAFIVLWGFALIIPACWAAILSAVGCIVSGYIAFADKWDEIHRDINADNAPRISTVREISPAVFGGPYENPGERR